MEPRPRQTGRDSGGGKVVYLLTHRADFPAVRIGRTSCVPYDVRATSCSWPGRAKPESPMLSLSCAVPLPKGGRGWGSPALRGVSCTSTWSLDRASCLHRFQDVYEALGYPPQHLGSVDVWCHHHSKGDQSWKSAMDRASGSGVFARDVDALLDVTELELPPEQRRDDLPRGGHGRNGLEKRSPGEVGGL